VTFRRKATFDHGLEVRSGWPVEVDGAIELKEMATAPTAVTDKAIIFAQDNGAGKTQLMVQFPSGSAQQIGIEA